MVVINRRVIALNLTVALGLTVSAMPEDIKTETKTQEEWKKTTETDFIGCLLFWLNYKKSNCSVDGNNDNNWNPNGINEYNK